MAKVKKNVLLIQPHSDDILFSASKYLFNRKDYDKIVLFTVEKDEKRLEEDSQLAELFDLKLIHGENLIGDKSYYEYYNVNKNKVFDYSQSDTCLNQVYNIFAKKNIKSEIRKVTEKYKDKGYEIVVCLGIGHPMHYFVRQCVEDLADYFYRDFPHSYKRKTKLCYEETLQDFKLSKTFDVKEVNDMKFEIAYNVYKTQRSLLFFEKGYIDKKIAEEFYVKI